MHRYLNFKKAAESHLPHFYGQLRETFGNQAAKGHGTSWIRALPLLHPEHLHVQYSLRYEPGWDWEDNLAQSSQYNTILASSS